MFGIGGGELVFIMFVALMLFGSDKIPEIARTLGKTIAQVKNATNEIKGEITSHVKDTGLDKSINDITENINRQINAAKENVLGETETGQIAKIKEDITGEINSANTVVKQNIEDLTGPIKRQS